MDYSKVNYTIMCFLYLYQVAYNVTNQKSIGNNSFVNVITNKGKVDYI